MNEQEKKVQALIAAWLLAGSELGIRVVAPFEFKVDTRSFPCIAFLPDFGGPKGMILQAIFPPGFAVDWTLRNEAEKAGYYMSFVNAELYSMFEPQGFQEALRDWGFFGPQTTQPVWTAVSLAETPLLPINSGSR